MDEEDLDKNIESPLPNDGDTPFSEPDEEPDTDDGDFYDSEMRTEERKLEETHPATDNRLDETELYNENRSGAAEAEEPNAGDSVVDFDKGEPPEQPPAKH